MRSEVPARSFPVISDELSLPVGSLPVHGSAPMGRRCRARGRSARRDLSIAGRRTGCRCRPSLRTPIARGVSVPESHRIRRFRAAPPTWRQRLMSACLASGGVAAGRSAARLHRLDRPGPSGTGVLRAVLDRPDRRGSVPESWRERTTERMLTHPELAGLERQHEIRDARGRVVARPDFAVVDARVGIEFHSDRWHFGPRRGRRDRQRDLDAVVEVVRARRRLYAARTGTD